MEDLSIRIIDIIGKIDSVFVNYLTREAMPIKNWRGQPSPITDNLDSKLKDCVGDRTRSISYMIKEAAETNEIFMKEGAGLGEIKRVCDAYLAALFRMTAMKGNDDCRYGALGAQFRVVKVVDEAVKLHAELSKARRDLDRAKGDSVDKIIAAVVASTLAKHAAARPGSAALGGSRKKRRVKRRRTYKR